MKLNLLGPGCRLLDAEHAMPMARSPGCRYRPAPFSQKRDADDYIADAVSRDPDLWVVEIEDRAGTNPFPGKIL